MISFWKQKNTKLLILNTISWIMLILFLILALYFLENISPYPERFTIADMDEEMIAQGQGNSLIIIYSLGSLAGFSLVFNIIMSSLVIYNFFVSNNTCTDHKQGPYYEDIKDEQKTNKEAFSYSFLLFLFYFLYFLFGFILIIYLWLIHIKTTTKHLKSASFILNLRTGNFKKHSRVTWVFILLFSPILLFGSLAAYILLSDRNFKNSWIPDSYVSKYLTLSNNKQNIIQLYFDRSVGILWNFLLFIDDKINSEANSFIKMFPEFTTYLNSVSPSSLTKISNPVIYAGPMFHPYLKEQNAHNWFSDSNNKDLTLDNWYFNSLKSEIEMLKDNGISYIGLNNLPYYCDGKMGGHTFGNMKKLQEDFDHDGIRNVITMTNAKLAEKIDNYGLNALETTGKLDYHVLSKLASEVKFTNTSLGGKFMTFFSQQTHEPYVYKKDGEIVQDSTRNGLVKSIWWLIQELKPFFSKLKDVPFYDEHGAINGTVYDHTLISVISDHGASLDNVTLFNDILNWCLENNYLNQSSMDTLLNFDYYAYNPTIAIKPFNEIKKTFTFNTDQIITLGDLVRIYELELNKINNEVNKAPYFLNEENIKKIKNQKLEEIIRNQILLNPLDPNTNSIATKTINNRNFLIADTSDWRYHGNKKTFQLENIQSFIFDKNKNSIFYNNHFRKW